MSGKIINIKGTQGNSVDYLHQNNQKAYNSSEAKNSIFLKKENNETTSQIEFGKTKVKNMKNADNSVISTEKDIEDILNGTYLKDKAIFQLGSDTIVHFKYNDCAEEDLVSYQNGIRVHKDCLKAFDIMQKAAKKDGVSLKIVSGYRSSKYQIRIFKLPSKLLGKTLKDLFNRAKFSAPSGFSEHHTGYAIDINSTEQDFADTKAGKWLAEHSKEYGFEMSFPENNVQGLGFEPWHFRFVGNDTAQKTFKLAREFENKF